MARLPRLYAEGILYYVTSKGGAANIFKDSSDYEEYLSLVNKYKKQYGFKLFSYVLLPTHLHLLIELKNNVGISNIMHDTNSLYTKKYNERYGKKGHLFQGRFKAVFAEKETHLLQLTRHVHLNPKRLNLVENPEDYQYSSHHQYVNPAKRFYPDLQEEAEEVFNVLGGREDTFQEYVAGASRKETDDFKKSMGKRRVLGRKVFHDKIKKAIEEAAREQETAPSNKARMLYLLAGGTFVLIAAITIGYFHHQTVTIKSKYDKTVSLYKKTLAMLEHQKEGALSSAQEREDYLWKIRLTEKALEDAQKEREQALSEQKELEGYSWRSGLNRLADLKSRISQRML